MTVEAIAQIPQSGEPSASDYYREHYGSEELRQRSKRLYGSRRWQALRQQQLQSCPLCAMCEEEGRDVIASVVDHKRKHRGDEALFFDPENLQSLCQPHHDISKHRDESRGYKGGCDASGNPLDPNHRWAKDQQHPGGGGDS